MKTQSLSPGTLIQALQNKHDLGSYMNNIILRLKETIVMYKKITIFFHTLNFVILSLLDRVKCQLFKIIANIVFFETKEKLFTTLDIYQRKSNC